jgi:hypothetical protein
MAHSLRAAISLVTLLLAGCAAGPDRNTTWQAHLNLLNRLGARQMEALREYEACVRTATVLRAPTKLPVNEAAEAALGACEYQLSEFRSAFQLYLDTQAAGDDYRDGSYSRGGNPMRRLEYTQRLNNEVNSVVAAQRRQAIKRIVDARSRNE